MSSTVLLVDSESSLSAIIQRHLEPATALVQVPDMDGALAAMRDRSPSLVVVNVDIAKGWPLCTSLKRAYATVPVVVVSYRLGKDVFNNHQKLDTRADAYHRLPEELDNFEISLGYFSSHKSETGHDEEDSAPNRPRPRKGGRVAVPTGVVQRLEATVAEQARALEDARHQIEALEAERDAVSEKSRRQMLELMAVAPTSSGDSGGADVQALRERVATLESELLLSARRDEDLRELRGRLETARAEVAQRAEELDKAGAERARFEAESQRLQAELESTKAMGDRARAEFEAQVATLRAEKVQLLQAQSAAAVGSVSDADLAEERARSRAQAAEAAEQLAQASVQLSSLANQLTTAHQARVVAEEQRRDLDRKLHDLVRVAAMERANALTALETRWRDATRELEKSNNAAVAKVEQLQVAMREQAAELERTVEDKKSIDSALGTSRKLMREYATDAARKAEDLKTLENRVRELEAKAVAHDAQVEELQQAVDFEKSLVESLEKDLAAARAQPVADPVELEKLRTELAAAKSALAEETANLEFVNVQLDEAGAVVGQLQRVREELATANAGLASLQEEVASKDAAIAALQQDVASKGEALAALQQDVASKGETIAALQQDVASKGEAIASLNSDLASKGETITALTSDLASKGEAIAALQQDVASKGEAIAALQQDVASKAGELASKGEELAALQRDIASKADALAALQQDVAAKGAEISALQTERDHLAAKVGEVSVALEQRELASREAAAAAEEKLFTFELALEAKTRHHAALKARFEALATYAKAAEARLSAAEAARADHEAKLASLVADLRGQSFAGEPAPATELPAED